MVSGKLEDRLRPNHVILTTNYYPIIHSITEMSIQYCAKVVIFLRKERKEMEGGNGVRQRRTELRLGEPRV